MYQTWAVQKANHQSGWRKQNSTWCNLPKGWGRSTILRSTSGRKYGWLGFWRRRISPVSVGRTIWNKFKMNPCTGRRWLQIFWRHSRTGSHWMISKYWMDSPAVGGYDLEEMCKRNSRGNEKRKARLHMTGNGIGRGCEPKSNKQPPWDAKFNNDGCD